MFFNLLNYNLLTLHKLLKKAYENRIITLYIYVDMLLVYVLTDSEPVRRYSPILLDTVDMASELTYDPKSKTTDRGGTCNAEVVVR